MLNLFDQFRFPVESVMNKENLLVTDLHRRTRN